MGLIANALRPVIRGSPPFPVQGSMVHPMAPMGNFQGFARAYSGNEIVFAAIEMLASSAGEPHIVGRKWQRQSPTFTATVANNFGLSDDAWTDVPQLTRSWLRDQERRLWGLGLSRRAARERMIRNGFFKELPDHSLVRLVNNPNPFMSRGQMWGTVVMDRALAGNAYLLKARVAGGPLKGTIAELWRLRPDRVKVIPDPKAFIAGYQYGAGAETVDLPAEDVIHFKTRSPLDPYYGMPTLLPIAGRIDIDEYQKGFLRSFYEQGGTGPGSILQVKQKLAPEAKEEIRERFRQRFGGPQGTHEMLILDQAEATYTQMGLNRGLRDALPKEIDNLTEARIAMAFGIPGSILGLLIGYESSSYANKRQDWSVFWDLTMTPLLSDLDDVLNLTLVPEYTGVNEVMFDLSDIRALQEDVDKMHDRYRKDLLAGALSLEEFREATGLDPNVKDGVFYIPSNVQATPVEEIGEKPEPPTMPILPEPEEEPAPEAEPVIEARCPNLRADGEVCGKLLAKNVTGADLWCDRCKAQVSVVN